MEVFTTAVTGVPAPAVRSGTDAAETVTVALAGELVPPVFVQVRV